MKFADYEAFRFELDDGVLTVVINRPEHQNAVDSIMHREFTELFHDIRNDDSIRSVVLAGAGDRYFCNGPDIDWYLQFDDETHTRVMREAGWIVQDVMNVGQPIVIAMNGDAKGFGSSLVALGDFVIVSQTAVLGDHHVAMGITAGDGGAMALPLSMGLARAKEYLLLGRELTGRDLVEAGIALRAVPAAEVLGEARALARRLADMPAVPLQATKTALHRQMQLQMFLTADGALAHTGWDYHLRAAKDVKEQLRDNR